VGSLLDGYVVEGMKNWTDGWIYREMNERTDSLVGEHTGRFTTLGHNCRR
jgi:hypothetical protein